MSGSLCWLRAASLLRGAPLRCGARLLSQAAAGDGGRGSRESVERLVRAHPVVVFMKGNPAQPLCGFSNAVVQILRLHGVQDFQAYDVLQDADLRQVSFRHHFGVERLSFEPAEDKMEGLSGPFISSLLCNMTTTRWGL
ncbi:glutaredoxin-related protein 5, mitochondrial isoform X2 [Chelonia mydas]|uniref:glutaredoxin-related protein 5, mitochondrial isoform X2 n=1 Tax=Chelonia mydas TaxID=8469 RepID=UPI0018A22530|nr:glutaredoxin-related protein 5, mitochondrial isoform X2 [Chelonia mydas]XP_037756838.1 glutaredoxin-related protein 5, mitochondrial isoform X2 [Chelonia mydas]